MPETTLYIRVKQALTWLKRNKGILQKDIADKMGITETSFTRGIARIKERNDEDFVVSFHSAVSEFISLDYLLTGNGNLVIEKQKSASPEKSEPTDNTSTAFDISVLIEKAVEKATAYADGQIESLKDQLEDKKRIIKLLEQKIEYLEAMQHIDSDDLLKNHPFPVGVADKEDQTFIRA